MRAKPGDDLGTGSSDLARQFVRERKAAGVVYVALPDQLLRQGPSGAPQELSVDELRTEIRTFLNGPGDAATPELSPEWEQRALDEVLQMCVGTPAPY